MESAEHDGRGPVARISGELVAHAPFSVSSVAIGLVLAGMVCILTPRASDPAGDQAGPTGLGEAHRRLDGEQARSPAVDRGHYDDAPGAGQATHGHDVFARSLFHLFHPVHMFFSAAATTAMFWRYERRLFKASIIGIVGAVGVCGISDIIMPFASQFLLVKLGTLQAAHPLHLHICLIESPALVLPFAAIGVAVGLSAAVAVERSTLFSHSLHVFSSTMASIFYLIGPFGRTAWIDGLGWAFLLVVLAVMLPCCASDIVFPLALARPGRQRYALGGHHAHH